MADIANAFRTSSCLEEAKVRLASYILIDKACDWWEEVGYALGGEVSEANNWDEFVTMFRDEFEPVIEVQQHVREFHDLRQTTETMVEITAMFHERALLVLLYVADE